MRPAGRVILAKPYQEGEDLAVTLLRVPKVLYPGILGQVFYVDGKAYKVPAKLNPIKVGGNKREHLLNGFYMECIK
jgi:hypothetical protein